MKRLVPTVLLLLALPAAPLAGAVYAGGWDGVADAARRLYLQWRRQGEAVAAPRAPAPPALPPSYELTLDPVTTRIPAGTGSDVATSALRLVAVVDVDGPDALEELWEVRPRAQDRLVTLATATTATKLRTPWGRQDLRNRVRWGLNQLLEQGHVTAVLFPYLVVQ